MCNVDWVVLKHIYFTRTIDSNFKVEIVVVAFSCFFVCTSDAKIIVYFKSFALKSAKVNVPLSVG